MTSSDIAEQFESIGLRTVAGEIESIIASARKGRWSAQRILAEIATREGEAKAQRSLDRRLRRSRIGSFKPLTDFDWDWPAKIERQLIESALGLDFVRDGRNLILLGSNGLGKTMIARNIAHQAVLAGRSVLLRTAAELLDDVNVDSPETRRRRIARYATPHLLCIDEIGYLSYDDHAADLLYKVVNPRYEARRSILITTNLAFKDWNTVFPNATCIATLLDRLTHHADVTVITGKSYRVRESELEARRRRKPKPDKTEQP